MKHEAMTTFFQSLSLLLFRASQDANLLIAFGPSYVITRFVIGKITAVAPILAAHFAVHGT